MKNMYLVLFLSIISFNCLAADLHYIDLTHNLSKTTLNWPTTTPFTITHTIAESDNGFYVSVRDYASNEHAGTHIDAPNHFAKGHSGVADIPLEQLIGSAIKVDASHAVKNNSDYQVGIKDFIEWEKINGKIPANTIVLISTGYGKYWPNRELYSGTKKSGAASLTDLHFPGLDPNAALWLVQERKIKAVGIDTFSIDYGQTKQFLTHQVLTKNNIPIFENIADMDKLPDTDFTIYALPAKIQDGTGAPLRIVAAIHE